jgi:hypothetical protein
VGDKGLLERLWPDARFCPKCDKNVGVKRGRCVWCGGEVRAFDVYANTLMGEPLTPEQRERRRRARAEMLGHSVATATVVRVNVLVDRENEERDRLRRKHENEHGPDDAVTAESAPRLGSALRGRWR